MTKQLKEAIERLDNQVQFYRSGVGTTTTSFLRFINDLGLVLQFVQRGSKRRKK